MVSLLGIINIYSGIVASHDKTSKPTWLWTILFTAQVSIMAFLYLFIDKWDYLLKQAMPPSSGSSELPVISASDQAIIIRGEDQKQLMVLEPCGKKNALKNLFD